MSTHNMFFVEKKEKYYAFTLSYLKLCRIPRKTIWVCSKAGLNSRVFLFSSGLNSRISLYLPKAYSIISAFSLTKQEMQRKALWLCSQAI